MQASNITEDQRRMPGVTTESAKTQEGKRRSFLQAAPSLMGRAIGINTENRRVQRVECGVEPPGPFSGSCPWDVAFAWRAKGGPEPLVQSPAGGRSGPGAGSQCMRGIHGEAPVGGEQTELGGRTHAHTRALFSVQGSG